MNVKRTKRKRTPPLPRDTPNRYIDKREGVRHVLHAAIRMTLQGEDPFAIHLLGQSAEKVCADLLERSGQEDPVFDLILPDAKDGFFSAYRESYNFLKHANTDHDGRLGVYRIAASNDLLIFGCIIRYSRLFLERTRHMDLFLLFAGLLHPGILNWDAIPGLKDSLIQTHRGQTRGQLAAELLTVLRNDPDIQIERQQDLADVTPENENLVPPLPVS